MAGLQHGQPPKHQGISVGVLSTYEEIEKGVMGPFNKSALLFPFLANKTNTNVDIQYIFY